MTHFTLDDPEFINLTNTLHDYTIVLDTKLPDDPFEHAYLAYFPTYDDSDLYDIEDALKEEFLTPTCITKAAALILKPTISVQEAK